MDTEKIGGQKKAALNLGCARPINAKIYSYIC